MKPTPTTGAITLPGEVRLDCPTDRRLNHVVGTRVVMRDGLGDGLLYGEQKRFGGWVKCPRAAGEVFDRDAQRDEERRRKVAQGDVLFARHRCEVGQLALEVALRDGTPLRGAQVCLAEQGTLDECELRGGEVSKRWQHLHGRGRGFGAICVGSR